MHIRLVILGRGRDHLCPSLLWWRCHPWRLSWWTTTRCEYVGINHWARASAGAVKTVSIAWFINLWLSGLRQGKVSTLSKHWLTHRQSPPVYHWANPSECIFCKGDVSRFRFPSLLGHKNRQYVHMYIQWAFLPQITCVFKSCIPLPVRGNWTWEGFLHYRNNLGSAPTF